MKELSYIFSCSLPFYEIFFQVLIRAIWVWMLIQKVYEIHKSSFRYDYSQLYMVSSTFGSTSEIVSPYCLYRTKNYSFYALTQQVWPADFEFFDFLTWKRKWTSFLVKYIWKYLHKNWKGRFGIFPWTTFHQWRGKYQLRKCCHINNNFYTKRSFKQSWYGKCKICRKPMTR